MAQTEVSARQVVASAPIDRRLRAPPLIERELRSALRKYKPERRRLAVAAAGFAAVLFQIYFGSSGRAGRQLHFLCCLAGIYFVINAPRRAAGIIAAERREQTLGLLFLSGLSALEIFLSKVCSSAMIVFTDLLAIMPMLALPFLMGGVSFDLFLATIFCLPTLLFFTLAVSLLGSAVSKDEGNALLTAVALAAAICVLPIFPYLIFAHSQSNAALWWLRLSPAYGPWLVFRRFDSGGPAEFWLNFTVTLIWSAVCLSTAAFVLSRSWEDVEQGKVRQLLWREWLKPDRRRLRSWLDKNPFVWLAIHNWQAWPLICFVSIIGAWGGWVSGWGYGRGFAFPGVLHCITVAAFLNLLLRCASHYQAAANLGRPRRDGGYELLLTTPLYPGDIVRGQLEALRLQFWPAIMTVLLLDLAMMIGPLIWPVRQWAPLSLLLYFFVWGCILFVTWEQNRSQRGVLLSMWISLNSARPLFAVGRAFGFDSGAYLVWVVLFVPALQDRWFQQFPTGSVSEMLVVTVAFWIFGISRARFRENAFHLERRLIDEFRDIVRESVPDPSDPRFKQWNVRERFPVFRPHV